MRLLRSSIGIRLETWRLVIVLGCVAGMLSGCEEFQKELKKKGTELEAAMKQATTLPKAPGQPPDRSQPSGPGGAPSKPGQTAQPGGMSLPQSSQAPDVTQFGPPTLRTVLGYPDLTMFAPGQRQGATGVERYIDYFDAEALESNPKCFAEFHLPQAEQARFIDDPLSSLSPQLQMARRMRSTTPKEWRGSNEFEQARSRQAFLDEYRARFQEAVIRLPAQVVFIDQTHFDYRLDRGAFVFKFGSDQRSGTHTNNGIWSIERGGHCTKLKFTTTGFLKTTRQEFEWKVPSGQAEELVNRLEPSHIKGRHQAYWGIVVELQKALDAGPSQCSAKDDKESVELCKKKEKAQKGFEVQATIKSIGLYEDPDLERLIKRFVGAAGEDSPQPAGQQPSATLSSPPKPEIATPTVTAPASTPPSGSTRVVLPPVRTALGRPRLMGDMDGRGSKNPEYLAFRRLEDLIVLGVSLDPFDQMPGCYLQIHLPASELSRYSVLTIPDMEYDGKPRRTDDTGSLPFWKGQNVFERARTKQAFVQEYRGDFQAAAVKFPFEIAVVSRHSLGPYDREKKTFKYLGDVLGGLTGPLGLGVCRGISFQEHFAPPKWEIEAGEAEKLVSRLPQERTVYWGTIVELLPIPGSTPQSGPGGVKVTIKSIGLYEDPDLERPIQLFPVKTTSSP